MKFYESIVISAPIDRVFETWADVESYSEWADPVLERTKLTEGPVGVGTKFHCVDQWPGRQMEFKMEITEYEKNRLFGASWSKPMEGRWSTQFTQEGNGTLLEFAIEMKPPFLMRLLSPIMRRYARRENAKFMQNFKQLVESSASETS
jgi:uncharacterized protein YndB with AHSA1/START domain